MPPSSTPHSAARTHVALGLLLNLAPILAFFWILVRESTNLPEMDDYDVVLKFLSSLHELHGFRSRLLFFIATEHVQYKLLFEHLVFVADLLLTRHVNFIVLQQFGNLFVLLIAIVLWSLFRFAHRSLGHRLIAFAPVVFLLFAPCYGETINWAMGSLQNLPVIFFALLSLCLLERRGPLPSALAPLAMAASIASSGNGLFLAPIGLLFLWQQRDRARAIVWTLVAAAMGGLYAYHYTAGLVPSSPAAPHVHLTEALFPLAFLGAAVGRLKLSLVLGLVFVLFAAFLLSRGWRRRDPATFYAAYFVFVTALGVDLTRHSLGLGAALTSRYSIYSQLFLCLLYMAAVRLELPQLLQPLEARVAFRTFLALTLLFCSVCDIRQANILHRRSQLIREHYIGWTRDPQHVSLVPDEGPNLNTPAMIQFRHEAVLSLEQAERIGFYHPPAPETLTVQDPRASPAP